MSASLIEIILFELDPSGAGRLQCKISFQPGAGDDASYFTAATAQRKAVAREDKAAIAE
jgi:hypothetical protein